MMNNHIDICLSKMEKQTIAESNLVPRAPSPPDESESDMEEASVSSTDSSMPGLVTD
jgi:hypothetical protein